MTESQRECSADGGFALVITLSLMVLLTLVVVGLLTLSAVSLRTSSQGMLMGQAQANARLAMMLALGEVQKSLGPDRRAAAPASMMLDKPAEPHVAGVWESWTWDPTQTSSAPDYAREKSTRFRGWLASDSEEPGQRLDVGFPLRGPATPVTLVGAGSAIGGGVGDQVHGGVMSINQSVGGGRQGYAWVALQEDVKAHVQPGAGELPASPEARFATLLAPDESGLTPLAIAGQLGRDRSKRQRAISTATLSLAGGEAKVARQGFHHLSSYSLGVLSDAAAGGMRRDLTSVFENFSASPLRGLRVYDAKTYAEPWWDGLAAYYNLAQRVKGQGGGGAIPLVIKNDLVPYTELGTFNTAPKLPVISPVLAKVDIVFSLVTQDLTDSNEATLSAGSWNDGWIAKYEAADPGHAHCMTWLVFEPIITLWNPYNVPIQFPSLSVGFNDLPIGVHVRKNAGNNGWQDTVGMLPGGDICYWVRFSAMNEGSGGGSANNCGFFVRLQGTSSSGIPSPTSPINLDPGEVRIFTAYVPKNATWASVKNNFMLERGVSSTYTGASAILNNAGNGVVFTAGWNSRVGGFRINRFANGGPTGDFVCLRRDQTDRFKVQLRLRDNSRYIPPEATDWYNPDPNDDSAAGSTFSTQICLMTGDATFADFNAANANKTLQKITLNEKDFRTACADGLVLEIPNGVTGADAYQAPNDTKGEGKIPFGVLSLTAKPTHDLLHRTKGWLFNNPVTANATVDDNLAPYPAQPYEMTFREIAGSNSFPMVDVDTNTETRGFFGPGQTSERGLTAATMYALPSAPMVSLGGFQSANLLASDSQPRFNYPLGNSFAHPLIPPTLVRQGANGSFRFDHSYALNWRLWDGYYFSTLSTMAKVGGGEFASGEVPLNSRLVYHAAPGVSAAQATARMSGGDAVKRPQRVATHQMIQGAFNVNSTSVEAWRAVLGGLRERGVSTRDGGVRQEAGYSTPFPRFLPAMTPGDEKLAVGGGAGNGGVEVARAARWVGVHPLSDAQIAVLARHIVIEIQKRGHADKAPVLTLGEFVNRRPGAASGIHALKGLLQTAIEEANKELKLYSLEDGDAIALDPKKEPMVNAAALNGGNTAEGSPAVLLQGDVLQVIGSFLGTHSDTLRIRGYGYSGEGRNRAQAWCEAIVQRFPEYLDAADAAEDAPPKAAANVTFGRRFRIISFRWLARDEI